MKTNLWPFSSRSCSNHKKGFTLIELAFVLIILGLLISIGADMLPMLVRHNKLKENQAIVEQARNALIGYAFATGRLPWASNNINGNEVINTRRGYLPYTTIGVRGTDAYGRTLFYAVELSLTPNPSNIPSLTTRLNALISGATIPDLFCATTDIMPAAFVVFSGGDNLRADAPNDDNNDRIITTAADNHHFQPPGSPATGTYDDILAAEFITTLRGRLP